MSKSNNRIFGLDVIRCAAIVCVLMVHWLLAAMGARHTFLSDALVSFLATYGVDLFFVLSGYLIGGIFIRDIEWGDTTPGTILNFWKRRWLRTLPNYYFYLALAFFLEKPWRLHLGYAPCLYPFFLQNIASAPVNFFFPSWSLAVEEWFYLLFPLAVAGLNIGFRSVKKSVLTSTVLFLAVPVLLRLALDTRFGHLYMHWIVILRLDSIGFGLCLAYVKRYHARAWQFLSSAYVLVFGLVGTLASVIWVLTLNPEYKPGDLPWRDTFFFTAFDVSCAALLPWFSEVLTGRGFAAKLVTWTSLASYSLYLSNQLAVVVAGAFLSKLHIDPPLWVKLLLDIAAAIGMSIFSYVLIEKVFLRFRDRQGKPPKSGDQPLKMRSVEKLNA